MSRTRISRGLVAAVGVVIVLGAVVILKKPNKSVANADKGNDAAAPPLVVTPAPQAGGPSSPGKPANPVAAPPNRAGQIALPGSAKALVTKTPGVEGPTRGTPPVKPA